MKPEASKIASSSNSSHSESSAEFEPAAESSAEVHKNSSSDASNRDRDDDGDDASRMNSDEKDGMCSSSQQRRFKILCGYQLPDYQAEDHLVRTHID